MDTRLPHRVRTEPITVLFRQLYPTLRSTEIGLATTSYCGIHFMNFGSLRKEIDMLGLVGVIVFCLWSAIAIVGIWTLEEEDE